MDWQNFFDDVRIPLFWAWALTLWQLMAIPVWFWQRRENVLGGAISWPKAFWLVFVIGLWFLLPLSLLQRSPIWLTLALSMWLRGVIEIFLCARGKWRTTYGIGHDIFQATIILGALLAGLVPVFWLVLTLITLVLEIFFVRYFVKATAGPAAGIFFVSSGKEYRRINLATTLALVLCESLFLCALWTR